jgi:hypothetical protein
LQTLPQAAINVIDEVEVAMMMPALVWADKDQAELFVLLGLVNPDR